MPLPQQTPSRGSTQPLQPPRTLVVHPLVFTTYAILALAAFNIQELALDQASRSLVLGAAASLLLLLTAYAVFRDWHKAGVIASALLLFFFSYGHLYAYLQRVEVVGVILGHHRYLLPACALLVFLIVVWLLRRRHPLDQATRLLNGLAIVLLAFPLFTIGRYWLELSREGDLNPLTLAPRSELFAPEGIPMPDIYYIILDGYARSDFMREEFGYDNSEFIRYLEDKGFYIAQNSHTNHFYTAFSLASSLNMEYVQDLGVPLERVNYPSDFVGPIRHGLVRTQLEELGYTTVAFRSGWVATEWIDADYYLSPDEVDLEALAERPSLNAFESLLVWSSATVILRYAGLDTFDNWVGARGDQPFDLLREIIRAAFDNLQTVPDLQGPKLVFAHIVAPHSPYLFDAQGNALDPSGPFTLAEDPALSGLPETVQKYRGQAMFVSAKVQEVVDLILERSVNPPVIIIQGDHGASVGESFRSIDGPGVPQRAAILNAYYLPFGCDRYLYPTITPVNTFRVVFNCYFSASYPLLEDITYHSSRPNGEAYDFTPVNDRLQGPP